MPDRPVTVGRPQAHRPSGTAPCAGPHDLPSWRSLTVLLCSTCWFQLPEETRRRLKLSGGSGRPEPVVRYRELRRQLAAGVPLNQIEVSP